MIQCSFDNIDDWRYLICVRHLDLNEVSFCVSTFDGPVFKVKSPLLHMAFSQTCLCLQSFYADLQVASASLSSQLRPTKSTSKIHN